MNKTFLTITGIFILSVIVTGIALILQKGGRLVSKPDRTTFLPDLLFRDSKGNYTSIVSEDNQEILLVFFNTTCDYCHEKARVFERKKKQIQGVKVYWISSEPQSDIARFLRKFNILGENISVLEDTEGYSYTYFDVRVTPTILHYNSKGIFVQKFPDDAPIGFIIDEIQNDIKY